jgi:TfoX/Sxy family transcriptional regulator of competence genes
LDFILGQLSGLEDITYRAMMGEYILYYKGKIVGGIYDDRLLVKPVKSAIDYMPTASYELPYDGAKEMLLVDEVDDKEYLTGLFETMYAELPTPKLKKKNAISTGESGRLKKIADYICKLNHLFNRQRMEKLYQNHRKSQRLWKIY